MKEKFLTRIKFKIITGLYIIYEITLIIGVILVESTYGNLERRKERVEK
jgi:hypothetical protein